MKWRANLWFAGTHKPAAPRGIIVGLQNMIKQTIKSDMRSPLAKVRDEWLASEEGEDLTHPGILRDRSLRHYLENRIGLAFLAGVAKSESRLNAERKLLRSILNQAANCINDAAHGHTPDWHRLVARIEKYEDAYAPLGDNC